MTDLGRLKKAELVAMVERLEAEAADRVMLTSIEGAVQAALPAASEMVGFDPARAQLALTLARALDLEAERGAAATARELRFVLNDLESKLGAGDESDSFWSGMSAPVGNPSD